MKPQKQFKFAFFRPEPDGHDGCECLEWANKRIGVDYPPERRFGKLMFHIAHEWVWAQHMAKRAYPNIEYLDANDVELETPPAFLSSSPSRK